MTALEPRFARALSSTHPGRTGISASTLGLGRAPLGDLYTLGGEQQARATIAAALDAGVTPFDVAPLWGHGLAEHRLGAVLSAACSSPRGRWRDRTMLKGIHLLTGDLPAKLALNRVAAPVSQ